MRKEVATWYANIWIAGNYDDVKHICREFCMTVGLCVTVTKTEYVYTGGQEAGVMVGLRKYPRFPVANEGLEFTAFSLAEKLRKGLFQMSYMIEFPDRTVWDSLKEDA